MADFKILYKNHCTPQEYLTENTRWYLDSDVGARLTGVYTHTTSTQPLYVAGVVLASSGGSPVALPTSVTFAYIKNTGEGDNNGDAVISFGGNYATAYRVKISPGENFCSMVDTTAVITVKSVDTATTIEYLTGVG